MTFFCYKYKIERIINDSDRFLEINNNKQKTD